MKLKDYLEKASGRVNVNCDGINFMLFKNQTPYLQKKFLNTEVEQIFDEYGSEKVVKLKDCLKVEEVKNDENKKKTKIPG